MWIVCPNTSKGLYILKLHVDAGKELLMHSEFTNSKYFELSHENACHICLFFMGMTN